MYFNILPCLRFCFNFKTMREALPHVKEAAPRTVKSNYYALSLRENGAKGYS